MDIKHFDFRRLYDAWDDALVGKRCIMADHIEEILEAVENGIDESEVISSSSRGRSTEGFLPFWSEEQEDYFCYAYVLDEDFVEEPEKPLVEVQWFRADVHNSLARSAGRVITDDDVDSVIDDIDWKALEGVMIEHGWVAIDTAVAEYLRGLE